MTTLDIDPAAAQAGSRGQSSLAGTGTLIRLLLRRDRVRLPAWVGGMGLFVLYIGAALPRLAPTEKDLASLVPVFTQPVGRMFTGPAFGMDHPSYEIFFAAAYAPYLFLLAAVMNIMLVTRHTRVEEQSGRAELVRAGVAGRHSALTAALVVAVIADVLVFLVVGALATGNGFSVAGSLLIGMGTALTGMAFAGVTAVTVQLSEYSRAAAGLAGGVLAAAFLMRALGDMASVGGSVLSWCSPLGWPAQTAPYVLDRWGPLLPLPALALCCTAVAYVLQERRDFAASLVPARRGPARARASLGRPLGLAVRLQRGGVLGWGIGILVLGVVDGAFTQAMLDAGQDMPAALQDMLGSHGLLDGYVSFLGSFVTVLVAAYVVFAMQSLRSEEGSGRADAILAGAVSRHAWCGAHLLAIGAGAVVTVLVTGVGTGLAAAAVTGDRSLLGQVLAAHVVLAPSVLVVLGLCAALFGWVPRLMAPIGWVVVAVMVVVAYFGELLDLPEWLRALSPLHHLPAVPTDPFAVGPLVVMLVAASAAGGVGLMGLRRRQIGVR